MFNRKDTKNKIRNHLQKDVIKIDRKTIFINPFLYWRRFDENTNSWLRELGQISPQQISSNRNRFFPELDWNDLSEEEKLIKDATVETCVKEFGGIDICVNNASAIAPFATSSLDMKRYDLMQDINTRGSFAYTCLALT